MTNVYETNKISYFGAVFAHGSIEEPKSGCKSMKIEKNHAVESRKEMRCRKTSIGYLRDETRAHAAPQPGSPSGRRLGISTLLVFLGALGFPVHADELIPAIHVNEDVVGNFYWDGTGGMDFVVHEPIEVIELGAYDSGLDGWERPITVQLWSRNDGGTPDDFTDDTGGDLLARLVFEGEMGVPMGSTRFLPLATPVLLEPGDYTISGWHGGLDWPNYSVPAGENSADHGITGTESALISFVGSARFGFRLEIGQFPALVDTGPAIKFAAMNFTFARPIDSDNDGMRDWWEDLHDLDPLDEADAGEDADGDGLTNLEEFEKGTDPREADTDQDGLEDGVETGSGVWGGATDTGTDPLRSDSDGDLLPDGVENRDLPHDPANAWNQPGTDPNHPDSDGDGASDGLEVATGRDPTSAPNMPAPVELAMTEDFDLGAVRSRFAFSDTLGIPAAVVDSGKEPNQRVVRLTPLSFNENNAIAWDSVDVRSELVQISFQFRMTTDEDNETALGCCGEAGDGFGIGLFDTTSYGETGPANPGEDRDWEDARIGGGYPDALFVGIDIFNYGTGIGGNNIRITGPTAPAVTLADVSVPFEMNDGRFHQANISIVNDGDDSRVFIDLIEDIHGTPVIHHLAGVRVPSLDLVNGADRRLIMGGRTGDAIVSTDVDNVRISRTAGPPFQITKLEITSDDPMQLSITWPSRPGESFIVEQSSDLNFWFELDDGYPSGGETTTFEYPLTVPFPEASYFRVQRQ